MEFIEVDVPSDSESPSQFMAESSDLACQVCGKPLVYSGRGRRPTRCDEHKRGGNASTSTTRRGGANVDSAMRTMESMYGMVDMGLMALDHRAMAEWASRAPKLLEQDRILFEADPSLTRRINQLTSRGSMGIFIGMHLSAIVPVAGILYGNVQAARAARLAAARAAREAAEGSQDSSGPADPGTYGAGAQYL